MMSRSVAAFGALVAVSAVGIRAMAQEVPQSPSKLPVRSVVVTRHPTTKKLEASFSFRDLIDSQTQRRLHSGLTTVIVLGVGVFRGDNSNTPMVGAGLWQSCRVTFDVWNEIYRIDMRRADAERQVVALNIEGVIRRCAEVRNVTLHGKLVPKEKYYLAATAEINPVSDQMLDQMRNWITKPPGLNTSSPGQTLFSSFVGFFVARIGKADRTLSFRTQAFAVPP